TVAAPAIPALPKQVNTANPPPAIIAAPTPAVPQVPVPTPQVAMPQPNTTPLAPQDPKLLALANDPAIHDLTGLIHDNPSDQAAFYKRGQIYASKGAYGAALNDFDQAIQLNPRDVEALNNRCWVRSI